MVKNTKGGSRHKKAKNSSVIHNEKVVLRDETCNEHYAYVLKAYGNAQFGVHTVETNDEGTLALSGERIQRKSQRTNAEAEISQLCQSQQSGADCKA